MPALDANGARFVDATSAPGFTIHRYRPRVEGLFARIERWTSGATGEIHWRSITRDDVTTIYGQTNASRVIDPADPDPLHPTRIFSWLICQSYDDRGNGVVYAYTAENDDGIDVTRASERNRQRSANRYLSRIRYGNHAPNRDAKTWRATTPRQLPDDGWMFDVVLDYGDGRYTEAAPDGRSRVRARADGGAAGDRAGPAGRTRSRAIARDSRCGRTAGSAGACSSFTIFPTSWGLRTAWCVRWTSPMRRIQSLVPDRDDPFGVMCRKPTDGEAQRYLKRSLPALDLDYTQAPARSGSLSGAPRRGRRESRAPSNRTRRRAVPRWVDLDAEGTAGVLTSQGDGWYYTRNVSAAARVVEGGVDCPSRASRPPSSWRRTLRLGWTRARNFSISPATGASTSSGCRDPCAVSRADRCRRMVGFLSLRIVAPGEWSDPNLRFVDLTGDGLADVLITEDEVLTWYPSLGEQASAARCASRRRRRGARPAARVRRSEAVRLPRRHVRRRPHRPRAHPQRRGLLLAEPRLRPLRRQGHDGQRALRSTSPTSSTSAASGSPTSTAPARPTSSTCAATASALYFNQSGNGWSDARRLAGVPARRRSSSTVPAARPARQRHGLPGLVVAAAGRRAARRCATST